MASTGVMKGYSISLYVGGTKVTHLTENSWNWTTNMLETTDKDSGENASFLPSVRGFTASVSCNFAEDSAVGYEDFVDAQQAGTALTIMRSSAVTGDKTYSGSAYISGISEASPNDGIVTFTVDFQGTAAVTKGTVGA